MSPVRKHTLEGILELCNACASGFLRGRVNAGKRCIYGEVDMPVEEQIILIVDDEELNRKLLRAQLSILASPFGKLQVAVKPSKERKKNRI